MPRERNYTNDGLHVPVRPGIFKLIGHEAYVCGPPGRPGGRKYKSLEEALAALPPNLKAASAPGPKPAPKPAPESARAAKPKRAPRARQSGKHRPLVLGPWSGYERALLDAAVEAEQQSDVFQCMGTWARIAERVPGRNAKQCRERWYNHQKPGLDKTPLTDAEDAKLRGLVAKHGHSGALLAREFPNRSENKIKNAMARRAIAELGPRAKRPRPPRRGKRFASELELAVASNAAAAATVAAAAAAAAEAQSDVDSLGEMDLEEFFAVDRFAGFPAESPPQPPKLHVRRPGEPPSAGLQAARQGRDDDGGRRWDRSAPYAIPATGFVLTGTLVDRATQLGAAGRRSFTFAFAPPPKPKWAALGGSGIAAAITGFMQAKKPRFLESAPELAVLGCAEAMPPPPQPLPREAAA